MDDALGPPPLDRIDPDTPEATADARAKGEQFPCPQCGSTLRFDPAAQGLSCGHCGWSRDVDPANPWAQIRELDYAAALRNAVSEAPTEEARVISCRSCGATTTLDPHAQADECPFCASPLIDEAGARRQIAPQGVLPFVISETEARKALQNWLSSRWFAPSDLSERARSGRPLDGVYLPFWTFDADTSSDYDGARGDAYYVSRTVTVNVNGRSQRRTKRVRKIRWRNVSGRVARFFDDLTVIASCALPARFNRRFEDSAWDLRALESYRPDFLAGFRAEVYSVDLEAGYERACDRMDQIIRRDIRRDIGGDKQRIRAVRTERRDVRFKHVLLPIWIAAYRYGDKPFRIAINGRTGEIVGERPYSWSKISITAIGALALLGGIAYLLMAAGVLD